MNALEIFGLLASVVVAISLMMSSLVRLRWFNLIGAFLFIIYGIYIGSISVASLNAFIVLTNIFYLKKIYSVKEKFKLISVEADNEYLNDFVVYYLSEIHKYFPDFTFKKSGYYHFMIHRNLNVGGLIIGRIVEKNLEVQLDFVIPEYRDFKIGEFVYEESKEFFLNKGIEKIHCKPQTEKHKKYLVKMGFVLNANGIFEYSLN